MTNTTEPVIQATPDHVRSLYETFESPSLYRIHFKYAPDKLCVIRVRSEKEFSRIAYPLVGLQVDICFQQRQRQVSVEQRKRAQTLSAVDLELQRPFECEFRKLVADGRMIDLHLGADISWSNEDNAGESPWIRLLYLNFPTLKVKPLFVGPSATPF